MLLYFWAFFKTYHNIYIYIAHIWCASDYCCASCSERNAVFGIPLHFAKKVQTVFRCHNVFIAYINFTLWNFTIVVIKNWKSIVFIGVNSLNNLTRFSVVYTAMLLSLMFHSEGLRGIDLGQMRFKNGFSCVSYPMLNCLVLPKCFLSDSLYYQRKKKMKKNERTCGLVLDALPLRAKYRLGFSLRKLAFFISIHF